MKKTLGFALALSLFSLPAPRARAMTMEEAGAKAMELIEGLANIIDKDKDDCDKMAGDVTKYTEDNAALIKQLNEMKAKRTDADKKAWEQKYAERLKAVQQKMMAGAEKCSKNEKVRAAFGKMMH
ncbi:MAG TPA: hypothetical protein VKE22_26880 [Haliangiales bacterium]|nr:hypothetical protein [Haliangiales bacterium]